MSRALRFAHARGSSIDFKRALIATAAAAVVLVATSATAGDLGGKNWRSLTARGDDATPEQYTDAALRREIAGDDLQSAELLRAALREDSEYAPALWHAGYVEIDGYWVKADDPFRWAARRDSLKRYRQRRDESPQTVAGQLTLARWCEAHDLPDQAMAHFYAVVALDPSHRVARQRLGFREAGGRWLSRDEIRNSETLQRRQQIAARRWHRRLRQIQRQLTDGNVDRRLAAEARLLAIDDPSAIFPMERILARASYDTGLLLVDAMAALPYYESSEVLARQAVESEWSDVREAATAALASRHHDHYVPWLLDALQTPIESEVNVDFDRRGRLVYRHTISREERDSRRVAVLDTLYPRRSRRGGDMGEVLSRVRRLTVARADARRRQAAIAQQNITAVDRNTAIAQVLSAATGRVLPTVPESLWQWWMSYNGLTRDGEKPLETAYSRQRVFVPEPSFSEINSAIRARTSTSCFAAGTGVWTETGLVPIETIEVGDCVLAQQVESGRLEYRPVLETTIRSPQALIALSAGDETLRVTKGHPFWVAGLGWTLAHQLEDGTRLHGFNGAVAVEASQPGPTEQTYNLVVAEFHSYFVGSAKLLVHDNTERQRSNAIVPGLLVARD